MPSTPSAMQYTTLGRTGLRVSRLAIGGGRGISSPDLRYAFDRGINFFFWSSDMHHHIYQAQTEAARQLFRGRGVDRDKVVLAVATYIDHPEKVPAALRDQLLELDVDHVDLFMWGWHTMPPTDQHRKAIDFLRDPVRFDALRRRFRSFGKTDIVTKEQAANAASLPSPDAVATAHGLAEEMKAQGYTRFVGGSFHDRALARSWIESGLADAVMLRYNPAHTGMEENPGDLLKSAPLSARPGTICFNSIMGMQRHAFHGAVKLASSFPDLTDLYRFTLRLPWVDTVLTGPKSRADVDAAIAALGKPPLTQAELQIMLEKGREFAGMTAGPLAAAID